MTSDAQSAVKLPRIAITFCTQCKWNLRAAYFAQELLQTFSTAIGEVALIPVTGGIFTVTITYTTTTTIHDTTTGLRRSSTTTTTDSVLWDRKAEGGFPETKELKNRVRNVIEPDRDLGHIDRSLRKGREGSEVTTEQNANTNMNVESSANVIDAVKEKNEECKDC